jgi:ribonucleoside-triphosphate reductase
MKIIKRSGVEVDFDLAKIIKAISNANKEVNDSDKLTDDKIVSIANTIETQIKELTYQVSVEEIQDFVELELMRNGAYVLAQRYIKYRNQRALIRQENTIDKNILSLVDGNNELIKQENSNKNPIINSTQRDYMAGEVSKDIARRYIIPEDLMQAHDEGILHIHDLDYLAQHSHNCCVFNLEDMLNNGTVISSTMIDKPKSFATACNIATQCVAQIASSQYGGQTFTLSHLAPFVDISRQKYYKEIEEESVASGVTYTQEEKDTIVEKRVMKEIKTGVQMIQYQILTLMTCNGQAPFVSIFMYLNEVEDEVTKHDLALIIEEVLNQRILGVKNEAGQYRTSAFPKLLYVLEEDNVTKDSKYWYLTELAAKCTAKRMVPDYISEKIMKENKEGNCFPCINKTCA